MSHTNTHDKTVLNASHLSTNLLFLFLYTSVSLCLDFLCVKLALLLFEYVADIALTPIELCHLMQSMQIES